MGELKMSQEKPRQNHITAGRDYSGVEHTKCGLIADEMAPSDAPPCRKCEELDG